jgi:hypothetical protein
METDPSLSSMTLVRVGQAVGSSSAIVVLPPGALDCPEFSFARAAGSYCRAPGSSHDLRTREPCSEFAVAVPEEFGVWGNTTENERRVYCSGNAVAAPLPRTAHDTVLTQLIENLPERLRTVRRPYLRAEQGKQH